MYMLADHKIFQKMEFGFKNYFLKLSPYLFFLVFELLDSKLTSKLENSEI